jgi:pimeloyl-ACP methyl ester carboxylesterase
MSVRSRWPAYRRGPCGSSPAGQGWHAEPRVRALIVTDSAAAIAAIGDALPVTVIWGRPDQIIPATQAGSVAGAVRRMLGGAGCMPHLERPAEVQAAIEETIARAGWVPGEC